MRICCLQSTAYGVNLTQHSLPLIVVVRVAFFVVRRVCGHFGFSSRYVVVVFSSVFVVAFWVVFSRFLFHERIPLRWKKVLYAELDAWRRNETLRIHNSNADEEGKQLALRPPPMGYRNETASKLKFTDASNS